MKLRNGSEEDARQVEMIVMTLRDLKEDNGKGGLIAALRAARGATPDTLTAQMLDGYGLTAKGRMGQTVRNVVLSAVTGKGELIPPVE